MSEDERPAHWVIPAWGPAAGGQSVRPRYGQLRSSERNIGVRLCRRTTFCLAFADHCLRYRDAALREKPAHGVAESIGRVHPREVTSTWNYRDAGVRKRLGEPVTHAHTGHRVELADDDEHCGRDGFE